MIAELKFLRKENAGLKDENQALKGEVTVSTRIIKIEQERGDFFKVAAEKGVTVGGNCGLMKEGYERMEATYKAEITRLAAENASLRESRKWRTVVSGAAGAGFGYWAGQQQCR